jgi:hypothetical protein
MGTLKSVSRRSPQGLVWAATVLAIVAALFLASGRIYASTSDTPTASSAAVAGSPGAGVPGSGVEIDSPRIGMPADDEKGVECADVSNFNSLKLAFGTSLGAIKYNARVDYDANGTVDMNDYNLLLRKFGTCVEVPWPIK